MRMIKKILNTIFDYPITHEKSVNQEIYQDYWDEYFKGKDMLDMEVPYFIESNNECRIYHLENYR